MVASLAGGFLYTLNSASPWYLSAALGLLSILLAAVYVRDPKHAEV
jgi:hypothetical protein